MSFSPTTRQGTVRGLAVGGFTAFRFYSSPTPPYQTASGTVSATFRNQGSTPVTLQLQESGNFGSGPYTSIGSAIPIVPGGQVPFNFVPKSRYLDILCSSGTGAIEIDLVAPFSYDNVPDVGGGFSGGIGSPDNYPDWTTL